MDKLEHNPLYPVGVITEFFQSLRLVGSIVFYLSHSDAEADEKP